MYIIRKEIDSSYQYHKVLCWCGEIFEVNVMSENYVEFECPKCNRIAKYYNCIELNDLEWDMLTDFRELCDCPDCGAKPGENHSAGCDTEVCPITGKQEMLCGCCDNLDEIDLMPWDGEWPGLKECRLFNLYSRAREKDDTPGSYWISCDADDPRGSEDLNTLYSKFIWNPELRHRVSKE